jgi:hypothetical protein
VVEKGIIGVYDSLSKAKDAVHQLGRGGFPIKQVSVLVQSLEDESQVHGYITAGNAARAGGCKDIWAGGLFEPLAGAAFLWMPGFGSLLVAGPLAVKLLDSVERTLAASEHGDVLGILAAWGVPWRHIVQYEQDLKAAKCLVVAHGNAAEGARAIDILEATGPDELRFYDKEIGLARFIARDPYAPAASRQELDDLLSRMDGVIDWAIHRSGDVTLEYDRDRISDDLIEDALVGIGFKLKHIFDKPNATEAEVHEALGH